MHRGAADDTCPGCLGDRRCWVCLGTGRLRGRQGVSINCHVCAGTGACAKCGDDDGDIDPPGAADLMPAPRVTSESRPVSLDQPADAARAR